MRALARPEVSVWVRLTKPCTLVADVPPASLVRHALNELVEGCWQSTADRLAFRLGDQLQLLARQEFLCQ